MNGKAPLKNLSTTSTAFLLQSNIAPSTGTNKDYLKTLLLQRFNKKYLGPDGIPGLTNDF